MENEKIKILTRKIIIALAIILVLEFAIFAVLLNTQPTKNEKVIDKIESYQLEDGFGYGTTDLGSTFYGISILDMLGQNLSPNQISNIQSFILSRHDENTGLFRDGDDTPSLHATYYAIGVLNKIADIPSLINKTQLEATVLALQTENSMFRDYDETDELHRVYGDLDSFFQAISVLSKLSTNTTEFYLSLNRTEIAQSLSVIQADDGSVNAGFFHDQYTMKNAYYVSSIVQKLNVSFQFFTTYGFDYLSLIDWIDSMYTHDGFRMTTVSEPTVEASAYALIALSRLGVTNSNITDNYHDGIQEIVDEMIEEVEEEVDPIDSLHDIILALSITGNLDLLDQILVGESLETTMGVIIAITSFLLLAAFGVNSFEMLKEDDSQYFDTALSLLLPQILKDMDQGRQDLSELMGIPVDNMVLIEHQDSSRGSLRGRSGEIEFLITFEFDTWDPLSLKLIKSGSTEEFYDMDFYESDLISEVQSKLTDALQKSSNV